MPYHTAPDNAAFDALPAGTVEALLADIPTLTAILTYHVVAGKVMSTDLVDGPVPTLNGADVVVDLSNGVMINDANVVAADIDACNGVIHVIDKVLLPPEPEPEPEPEMSMSMPAVPPTLPATTEEAPPDPTTVPATDPAVTDPTVGATGTSPSKAAKEEDHSMQTKASKSANMLGKSVKAEKVAKATKASTKAEKSEPKPDTKAKKLSSKSAAPKTPKERKLLS